MSLLLYPFAILAVLGVGWMTGAGTLNSFTLSALVMAAGPPVIIYFVFAFFEEVGWLPGTPSRYHQRWAAGPRIGGADLGFVAFSLYGRAVGTYNGGLGDAAAPLYSRHD
ncbi:MAG: hypothetical protein KDE58_26070, partial [Caldilineaceae bacterium]|nr:hypothetical protein [Caldilineaceae bacterium]